MRVAPEGVAGPCDGAGLVGEHATSSANTAPAAMASFVECIVPQGVKVGGVTSVLPAMMRPILIRAGLLMLSQ